MRTATRVSLTEVSPKFYGQARLTSYGITEESAIPQQTDGALVFSLSAEGGGVWSLETGEVQSATMFTTVEPRHLSYAIPPGGRAVFRVYLYIGTALYDRSDASYDFADVARDYYLKSPYLMITHLNEPSVQG